MLNKYTISSSKKGNFWIGTNDVPKGETSITDYWNGITPPLGGYTIYLGRATNGPVIYVQLSQTLLYMDHQPQLLILYHWDDPLVPELPLEPDVPLDRTRCSGRTVRS
jgi:hypothetical protein